MVTFVAVDACKRSVAAAPTMLTESNRGGDVIAVPLTDGGVLSVRPLLFPSR